MDGCVFVGDREFIVVWWVDELDHITEAVGGVAIKDHKGGGGAAVATTETGGFEVRVRGKVPFSSS